ncbi:MAG: HAMP domain-containing sensor histidine kinase [Steroidobacteraceae bacterium]|jgi:signal transduction histidine kinase
MLGLVVLAVWTDRRGYQQVRESIAAQERYRLDLFLRQLDTVDGQVVLANLDFHAEARELRPTQVATRTRVMRATLPDEYVVGRPCYLSFQLAGLEALNACAAVDRTTSAVSNPGRYLYLIVRFDSSSIVSHLSSGAPIKMGDFFELEILRNDGTLARWVLVLDQFSAQGLLDAQGYARDERVDPGSYQITAYRADPQWEISADAARHSDHHLRGSFVSAPMPGQERMLSLAVDMTGLSSFTEPWPIPGSSVLIRFAHLRGNASGSTAELRGATYEERAGAIVDQAGTPLVSARSLYISPGTGETVELYKNGDPQALWSGLYPAASAHQPGRRFWSGWRARWLDTSPMRVASTAGPAPGYEARASIPASSAIAVWNEFAPRLALSFLAMLAAVAVLYVATMRAVLSRLMHLAGAAAASAGGTVPTHLPYGGSSDELGILSRTLSALIEQIREDALRRERESQERVKREYQTLRVIGHHIRSPIQALLALNPPTSRSWPYIDRINKAVQAVFGGDALRDAFSRMYGEAVRIDLADFLAQLAGNASHIGINAVEFSGPDAPVPVEVDDGALSDAIVQVLNNADRFRLPLSTIRIGLVITDGKAIISIANSGPQIPPAQLEDMFEFGVSLTPGAGEHQGQGLFVARELVMKMHGSIVARNLENGVAIEIALPLARSASSA